MQIKKKQIKGGYTFQNIEGKPKADVMALSPPTRLVLPLKQGYGDVLQPLVKTNESVTIGQIVARDDNSISSPIHAPVSGEIVDTIKIDYLGEKKVPALVIEAGDEQKDRAIQETRNDWKELSEQRLEELLYTSGVAGLGNGGLPTSYKSSIINKEDVEHIIVAATDSDLWEPAPGTLLPTEAEIVHFVEGITILKRLYPKANIHIVISETFSAIRSSVDALLNTSDTARLYSTKPRYPLGTEESLVQAITGNTIPYGFSAINMGIVVVDIQTVQHVREAITNGTCLTERTIALGGKGFSSNIHLKVKIGTSIDHILQAIPLQKENVRFIRNSILLGKTIRGTDFSIDKHCTAIIGLEHNDQGEILGFAGPGFKKDSFSNTFLSLLLPFKKTIDTNLHGERRGCINCGFCVDICPAEILPNLLHRYVERKMVDETLVRFKIFDCIRCNLCTYVCPSKIPVATYIYDGMKELITEGLRPTEKLKEKYNLKGTELLQEL